MKKIQILTFLAAATLIVVGCKKETPVEKAVSETKEAAGSVVDAAKNLAGNAADAVKDAAEKAKEAGQKAVAAATDKAQELIDKAKSLVSEGKYQDALTTLNGLSSLSLSESQQKAVDSLKSQIQEAISKKTLTDGANAMGDMLKK